MESAESSDGRAGGARGPGGARATERTGPPVDAWLVPPDTAPQRVADTRRQPMRLSALFEEFWHFLRVEKEAAPRTIETYRWCFGDYESFVMKQIGGTVLVTHFTAETCRAYQYDLAARATDQQHSRAAGHAGQLRQVGGPAGQARAESHRCPDSAAPQGAAAAGAALGNRRAGAHAMHRPPREGPRGTHVLRRAPPGGDRRPRHWRCGAGLRPQAGSG